MDFRKLLALGTGAGIEIGAEELKVVLARVRPGGVAILGHTTIGGFRERPAAEWGAEYAAFLKKLGGGHLAATALLPRSELLVRQLSLPGVSDRDLGAAIQYQADALHPYGEDEARYAFARLGRSAAVLIAIARAALIDRYAGLFSEAGIKLASMTVSPAALYSAARLLSAPPADGFLTTAGSNGNLELYGESPARPLFSAVVDALPERAAGLAAAELRLSPEAVPLPVADLLPAPERVPDDYEPTKYALAYAGALTAACPRLALRANLLPETLRAASSRARFIPTAALAITLLALGAAVVVQGKLEERRYLENLQREIAKLEPRAAKAAGAEQATEATRARVQLLDDFRSRTQADLDLLQELTKLLPPPGWLSALEITRDSVSLSGEAEQAATLLKTLDNSALLRNSEFTMPIARTRGAEIFRIRAQQEGARP